MTKNWQSNGYFWCWVPSSQKMFRTLRSRNRSTVTVLVPNAKGNQYLHIWVKNDFKCYRIKSDFHKLIFTPAEEISKPAHSKFSSLLSYWVVLIVKGPICTGNERGLTSGQICVGDGREIGLECMADIHRRLGGCQPRVFRKFLHVYWSGKASDDIVG